MALARGHIPDGFEAGAAQASRDGLIGAECEHRQRTDRIGFPALADNAAMGMASQGSCADGRAGNRAADGKALRGQRRAQKMHQCGLAAEQMRATGDVEKQAMRRIERHQRREAVAPVGDVIQQFGVGGLIGVEDF